MPSLAVHRRDTVYSARNACNDRRCHLHCQTELTSLSGEHGQGRCWRMPLKKNKKEYKVIGKKFWRKSKKCGYRWQCPNNGPRVQCKEVRQLRKASKRNSGKKESSVKGHLRGFKRPVTRFAMEDIGRFEHCAGNFLRKNTDTLRRVTAQMSGMGGVTLSYVCPHCSCFLLDDYVWWVSSGHGDGNNRRRSIVAGGAQHAEAKTNEERPTGYWRWCKSEPTESESLQSARSAFGSV